MSTQNSFAKLFRSSAFARFDPAIPRIYTAVPNPPHSRPIGYPETMISASRPAHFGFKRDIPPALYGKPLSMVSVSNLDGDFGQAVIEDGTSQHHAFKIISELHQLAEQKIRIPGRALNKSQRGDGWAVGIGGVVGHLAMSEMPEGFRFSQSDVNSRRAYWMYVKKATMDADGKPHVYLSFRKPFAIKD